MVRGDFEGSLIEAIKSRRPKALPKAARESLKSEGDAPTCRIDEEQVVVTAEDGSDDVLALLDEWHCAADRVAHRAPLETWNHPRVCWSLFQAASRNGIVRA